MGMTRLGSTLGVTLAFALTIFASVTLPVPTVGTVTAQQNTTTATTPASSADTTADADICSNPSRPQMDQALLSAPRPTMTAGEPARIEAEFSLKSGFTCPVEVQVTLQGPHRVIITGGNDWSSTSNLSTTFIPQPGQRSQTLSVNIYSSEAGQLRVDSYFRYYPVNNPELANEAQVSVFFEITEPNPEPPPTSTSGPEPHRLHSIILAFVIGGILLPPLAYLLSETS